MPSSAIESVPYIIEFIRKYNPEIRSVLDIGIGFGKNAFLLREYFDVKKHQAFQPNQWQLNIVGIDIYDGYISDLQKMLYSQIVIGDVFEELPNLGQFDVVILSDVLEHFSKEDGLKLLNRLFDHSSDIVIATPQGFLEHSASGDNPHEEHKSGWILDDFESFNVIESTVIPRIRKKEEVLVVYLRNEMH